MKHYDYIYVAMIILVQTICFIIGMIVGKSNVGFLCIGIIFGTAIVPAIQILQNYINSKLKNKIVV